MGGSVTDPPQRQLGRTQRGERLPFRNRRKGRPQKLSTHCRVSGTMEPLETLESLRDPTRLREALSELGLDLETIQLVADLAPSRGITAYATETSVSVE